MLMRLLRHYLQPYRSMIIATIVLATLGTMGALYLPSLNAEIIDDGVATGDTAFICRTGAIMLAVSAVQIVCSIGAVYFGAKTAMAFGRDVRAAIFDQVLTFSDRELNRFGAPSLITRNTNDVQQVQMLVLMTCTVLLSAPITMIGGIFMALREDLGLSWLVVVGVPVLVGSIWLVVRMMPRCSARCRAGSTWSTGCCASRSPASGWSARSSGNRSRRRGSPRPTAS